MNLLPRHSCLIKNISLFKIKNVKAFKYAISDKDGIAPFYLATHRGYDSLYKQDLTIGTEKVISCKTYSLSSIFRLFSLAEVDLIKIDVEGAEDLVLKGAEPIIERVRTWVVEIHDLRKEKEIINYFHLHGFKVMKLGRIHIIALRRRDNVR